MNKFVFEFASERNVKIVFFNFYNSITTKKINVMNYISINKKTHKQFIEKENLIEQKNYEFYNNIYDNTNHKNNDKNKGNAKKSDNKKKFDENENKKKIDFEDNVMMFN